MTARFLVVVKVETQGTREPEGREVENLIGALLLANEWHDDWRPVEVTAEASKVRDDDE